MTFLDDDIDDDDNDVNVFINNTASPRRRYGDNDTWLAGWLLIN